MSFPSGTLFPSSTLYPGGASPSSSSGLPPHYGEFEILVGRRAFSAAQQRFAGGPLGPSQKLAVGWHDTSVNRETGSFAVVRIGLEQLVGEIVRVTSNRRQVFAYVLATADVPVDLSLTRRLFLALNRLSIEALPADVVAVG